MLFVLLKDTNNKWKIMSSPLNLKRNVICIVNFIWLREREKKETIKYDGET